jgi:hypothetical protein
MSYASSDLTAHGLQTALVQELTTLFSDTRLQTPSGGEKAPKVYEQQLPIPTDDYDADLSYAPFIVVQMYSGKIENWSIPAHGKKLQVDLLFGVYNNAPDRSGHVELLNMIQRVENHLGARGRVKNFILSSPFEWVLDNEDSHPNYFGAATLVFDAPRVIQEDPFT